MPDLVQNNNVLEKPHVVIALLDWGLGHTTRSIPIIRHLMEIKCNVIVACNSNQKALLVKEFPDLSFENLEGYNIRYASKAWLTVLYIIFQVPKILTKINRENKWLHQYSQQHPVHFIISDNRYGFRSHKIPSIFITHQLSIKSGVAGWIDKIIQKLNNRYINRFAECWVPDYAQSTNLAGQLSRINDSIKIPTRYIGALSRFNLCQQQQTNDLPITIVLSGPEPQRSIFEKLILNDIGNIDQSFVLIRGLPIATDKLQTPANTTVINHLTAHQLNQQLCNSSFVISRSGYTSIMDYMKLGLRSILVPTPGQAEQEYLAEHLSQSSLALTVKQHEFSLKKVLGEAARFPYRHADWNMEEYKAVIEDYLKSAVLNR